VTCLHDLEQLIGDMLQFARGTHFTKARFTVGELLRTVETSARVAVRTGQILNVTHTCTDQILSGNREALAGAILNLVSNALGSAGERGHVNLGAQLRGLDVQILVSDDGPGVADDIRDRIFDPFFTSRPDGTGLGLAVARSVARAHHGDVVLVNTGVGARFVLQLPLQTSESAAAGSLEETTA
jgi:two-component system sensor histidine kinase FlrB